MSEMFSSLRETFRHYLTQADTLPPSFSFSGQQGGLLLLLHSILSTTHPPYIHTYIHAYTCTRLCLLTPAEVTRFDHALGR